ncbi:hypothetical protein NP493_707g01020 [Ridgeia piscesae]|uniref:PLAT domain-containing protein n=1 Tax=Ridgeia piscesae TaxID=27915 RepID=A0AAD9NMT7_RIDPI|nr:hypothetical protein NP493_707g01020 [Ridgeia piscesae]
MIAARLACLALVSLLFGQLDTSDAADCQYRIKVRTGLSKYAGTDGRVYIKLYDFNGQNGGWKQLDTPANDFERGSTGYFTIRNPCLRCITKIGLRLIYWGKAPGWFVKTVGVRRMAFLTSYQTFGCYKWMTKKTSLTRWFSSSYTPYSIRVYTGNVLGGGTSPRVQIRFKAKTWSPLFTLSSNFGRGTIRTFFRSVKNACKVTNMMAKHGAGQSNWYVQRIVITNKATKKSYVCWYRKWIGAFPRNIQCVPT